MNTESHGACATSRSWRRRFTPAPRSVPAARREVLATLAEWSVPPDASDTIALIVSELSTNAVRHGRVPGRLFEVVLAYDGEKSVEIEVSDASRCRPVLPVLPGSPPALDSESGRGLLLVAALSDAWEVRDRGVGKTLWVRVLTA
ncbi:ATP-binding protein [Streptomyces sp. PSKA54]|uniref:ATP-binding protein n=1 Tax=Streptomyces himalayensis subsp. aureolus TaxID=2758039 RepID=A0A7W2CWS1_9ACTN|nr:ATP-binding protein [Streptomyces himalayensis]MBA4860541.1 ATP-binding protein [Streptomyces himalayensis subsp. aureolus]